jgi:hypothetical protein
MTELRRMAVVGDGNVTKFAKGTGMRRLAAILAADVAGYGRLT